jgi:hypothetical protein
MSLKLQPDDFEAGMFVAVLNAPLLVCRNMYGDQHEHRDERLTGVPLKVLAVSRPYFAAMFLVGGSAGQKAIFDLRTNEYCKLTDEYVAALMAPLDAPATSATEPRVTTPTPASGGAAIHGSEG